MIKKVVAFIKEKASTWINSFNYSSQETHPLLLENSQTSNSSSSRIFQLIKTPLPSQEKIKIIGPKAVSWIVSGLDATGNPLVIGYTGTLVMFYSWQVVKPTPENLEENPALLIFIGVLPIAAFFTMFGYGIKKNEIFYKNIKWRSLGRQTITLLYEHPSEIIMITLAGLAEAIVIFENCAFLVLQFGVSLEELNLLWAAITVSSFVALQFIIMEGLSLLDKKTYNLPPKYNMRLIRSFPLLCLAIAIINLLPIASATGFGLLGFAEAYTLLRRIIRNLEAVAARHNANKIADRVAILPAFLLAAIFAVCHFALCGLDTKIWLAKKFLQLRKGLRHFFQKNFVPTRDNLPKKILIYLSVGSFCLLLLPIIYSAFQQTIDILNFGDLPFDHNNVTEDYSPPKQLSPKWIAAFITLGIIAVIEAIATAGKECLKTFGISKVKEEEIIEISNNSRYTMKHLLFDTMQFLTITSTKVITDFTWPSAPANEGEEESSRTWIVSTVTGLAASFLMLAIAYDRAWHQNTVSQTRNPSYAWFWLRILLLGTLVTTLTYSSERLTDLALVEAEEDNITIKTDNLILLTGICSGSFLLFAKYLMFPVRQSGLVEGISHIGRSIKNCWGQFWHKELADNTPSAAESSCIVLSDNNPTT